MWLPIVGLLLGIAIGLVLSLPIPTGYTAYLALAILAGLDAVMGGIRAELQGEYDNKVFLSGFLTTTAMALGLVFVGTELDTKLHIAAIAAFGIRIFNNLAIIRRRFL
jgi:small basic protein